MFYGNNKEVFVSMSGGVDSSVAAYMLNCMGYKVTALYINSSRASKSKDQFPKSCNSNGCYAQQDISMVARICDALQIPFYIINMYEEYIEHVINPMLQALKHGLTPNPDVLCNQKVKFDLFLRKTQALDIKLVATGHYAKISACKNHLIKSNDTNKDQTYFLHKIPRQALQQTIFPIGHMQKQEVKHLAYKIGLPTYDQKESMGICLLHHSSKHFKDFLLETIGETPGMIITENGEKLGEHAGLHFFTTGQRQGLKIGGNVGPLFVVGKNITKNLLIVSKNPHTELLYTKKLGITDVYWISSIPTVGKCYMGRIRHQGQFYEIQILRLCSTDMLCESKTEIYAVAPGQFLVLYDNDICLGGGIISHTKFTNMIST